MTKEELVKVLKNHGYEVEDDLIFGEGILRENWEVGGIIGETVVHIYLKNLWGDYQVTKLTLEEINDLLFAHHYFVLFLLDNPELVEVI